MKTRRQSDWGLDKEQANYDYAIAIKEFDSVSGGVLLVCTLAYASS